MTVPGPVAVPVVFDVNVFVLAVERGRNEFRSWPSPPPTTTNPSADCLGVINDAAEFALWLSPHITGNVASVLGVLGWAPDAIERYLKTLADMAVASGGGIANPPATVSDSDDWEDNRVLDLAVEVGAHLLVSADCDLTTLSPWRGRPILEPRQFAALVDGARRARRRLPRQR